MTGWTCLTSDSVMRQFQAHAPGSAAILGRTLPALSNRAFHRLLVSLSLLDTYFNTIDPPWLPDYALPTRAVSRLENWKVPLSADQAGKSAVELAAGPSVKQDTTAVQLWHETNSQLEKALEYYDKRVATVSAFLTVGFSHARYPAGKDT
jgi:hypothetical protein